MRVDAARGGVLGRLRAKRRHVGACVAALALVILLGVGTGASGAEVRAGACPPPAAPAAAPAPVPGAEPAPTQVLVCVGSQAITGATYSHWLTIARKGTSGPTPTEAHDEVLGFLISAGWVKGESAAHGISVSARTVKKEFRHLRAAEFHKRGEFAAFLRSSGQTIADLLLRVELNLLSQRLQRHALAGHRGKAAKEHALERFVKSFRATWMTQTYCAPQYAVSNCGHVQEIG